MAFEYIQKPHKIFMTLKCFVDKSVCELNFFLGKSFEEKLEIFVATIKSSRILLSLFSDAKFFFEEFNFGDKTIFEIISRYPTCNHQPILVTVSHFSRFSPNINEKNSLTIFFHFFICPDFSFSIISCHRNPVEI